jgi:hypothetical protein
MSALAPDLVVTLGAAFALIGLAQPATAGGLSGREPNRINRPPIA